MDTQRKLIISLLNSQYNIEANFQEIEEYLSVFSDIGTNILDNNIRYNESALNQYGDELSYIIAILQNTTQDEIINASVGNVNASVGNVNASIGNVNSSISKIYDFLCANINTPLSLLNVGVKTSIDTSSSNIVSSISTLNSNLLEGISDINNNLQSLIVLNLIGSYILGKAPNTSQSSSEDTTDPAVGMLDDITGSLISETTVQMLTEYVGISGVATAETGGLALPLFIASVVALAFSAAGHYLSNSKESDENSTVGYTDEQMAALLDKIYTLLDSNTSADVREEAYNDLLNEILNQSNSTNDSTGSVVSDDYGYVRAVDGSAIEPVKISPVPTTTPPQDESGDNQEINNIEIAPWLKKRIDEYVDDSALPFDVNKSEFPYAVYNNYLSLDDLDRISNPNSISTARPSSENSELFDNLSRPYIYDENIAGFPEDKLDLLKNDSVNNEDKYNLKPEDSSYLLDSAQSESEKVIYIENTPNITINFGDVHETADVNQIISHLNRILKEEIVTAPEGAMLQ